MVIHLHLFILIKTLWLIANKFILLLLNQTAHFYQYNNYVLSISRAHHNKSSEMMISSKHFKTNIKNQVCNYESMP